jgi:coenzyme F420-reducing hydrogenase delta subunit
MNSKYEPKIHVFYCVNAFDQGVFSPPGAEACFPQNLKMACSSMIKDVYILKAFECGADGVMVVACPEGKCKRVDGNIRAAKRVARVQQLLDEIGLGGKRLIYTAGDEAKTAAAHFVKQLVELGPRHQTNRHA